MIDYRTNTLAFINRLSFASRKELVVLFTRNGFDISHEEWVYLLILWSDGEQSPSQLATMTSRDRTTITRLIDGMAAKDLIVRKTHPEDRRRSLIALTPHGHSLQSKLMPLAIALTERAQQGIAATDIATTIATLAKMQSNLESAAAAQSQTEEIADV